MVCEFVMVDSEARRWREGHVLLADTSFVPATRNDCEADRVVLHFTVWHPDLAAAERDGIVRLHEAGARRGMAFLSLSSRVMAHRVVWRFCEDGSRRSASSRQ